MLFYSGKSIETFVHVKEILETKLENINKLNIRPEYKLWIYENYFLPSHRFLLTVHDINFTHLKKLDTLSDKFVKKWAGLPPSATNNLIYMRAGLKIQSITGLYTEAHCVSHARTRLQGDNLVNTAIDSKIERESALIRKKCLNS